MRSSLVVERRSRSSSRKKEQNFKSQEGGFVGDISQWVTVPWKWNSEAFCQNRTIILSMMERTHQEDKRNKNRGGADDDKEKEKKKVCCGPSHGHLA